MLALFIILGIAGAVFVYLLCGIRIACEYERGIVFRLGRYKGNKGPGLYWIIPFIEWKKTVDLRTRTVDIECQDTVTKDSVTIKVNAVLWFKIKENDPQNAVIVVEDYYNAVYQLALTSLRNIIGQHDLDEVLNKRTKINDSLKAIVDEGTDDWSIQVDRVEMKDVEIPEAMQRAMAREAEAIREKRARLIKAEAELEASEKLTAAAEKIAQNPAALELRRMQMINEVGAEHNTTTIMLIPSDFITLAKEGAAFLSNQQKK